MIVRSQESTNKNQRTRINKQQKTKAMSSVYQANGTNSLKVIQEINNDLKYVVNEDLERIIQELPSNFGPFESDDELLDAINDVLDASPIEYNDYLDVYYYQTEARGDTGVVCAAVREELEHMGYDYILSEDKELLELEGVQRANRMVNIYASIAFNYLIDSELIIEAYNNARKN